MNIVHYLQQVRLADGGVVRFVLDITALLASRGHRVTLLTCDDRDVPTIWDRQKQGAPTVVRIPVPSAALGRFGESERVFFREAVRDNEVLHLHNLWDPTNTQAAKIALDLGLPYVISSHGMLDDWSMSQRPLKKRIYYTLFGKKLLSRACAVHCTAQGELDQACKWFPKRLGVVIPPVLDLHRFEPGPGPELARTSIPGFERELPTVLFISRLHVKKGVELLIRSAETLKLRGVSVTFLVAGSGDETYARTLRALAKQLRVTDSVRFLGLVTGVQKISLLQAADISLLPTSQENFGFAIVEAMASGTPVVTTRAVDIWPELERSGGGVLVEQESEAIADAIEGLVDDPARREAMGRAARQWAFETFGGDAIVQSYEDRYRMAITQGGASA